MKYFFKNVNDDAVIKQGKLRTFVLFKSGVFQKEVYIEIVTAVNKRKCLSSKSVRIG